MGRGRQKAKQAKVARELKYDSGSIDLNALAAELHGSQNHSTNSDDLPEGDYSKWIDEEEDEEETDEN
ncbi:MAG: hypothetical protein RL228_1454 [Actinomycetota bacterium]|jgi:hypothetical protein